MEAVREGTVLIKSVPNCDGVRTTRQGEGKNGPESNGTIDVNGVYGRAS